MNALNRRLLAVLAETEKLAKHPTQAEARAELAKRCPRCGRETRTLKGCPGLTCGYRFPTATPTGCGTKGAAR